MVDVGAKPATLRSATARAVCTMNSQTADQVRANTLKKGDVLQVARLAGIMAAKRTDELIPLCHSLVLDSVSVEFEWLNATQLQITAVTRCTGKTGVEMEAMLAASLASLTVYDMCKSSDREIRIDGLELIHKSGGVHGEFKRRP